MSVPAVYLVEAEDDVVETHAAYEKSQPGLGDRFLISLQYRVQQIQSTPKLYGVFRRDIRAAPLAGLPIHRVLPRSRYGRTHYRGAAWATEPKGGEADPNCLSPSPLQHPQL